MNILRIMFSKKALEYRLGTIIITVFWITLFSSLWGHTGGGLVCSACIIGTKFFWYGIHELKYAKSMITYKVVND